MIHFLKSIVEPNSKEIKIKLLYFLYDFINIKIHKHEFLNSFIQLNEDLFYKKLEDCGIAFNLSEFLQLSLYDAVEYLINVFELAISSDAYIQFFLDEVFDFQQKNGSSIVDFLEYWNEKGDTLNIVAPESKNAVRIITVHKAKGLEFPVIIYPFDTDIYFQKNAKVWYNYDNDELQNVLVNCSKELSFAGNQGSDLQNTNTKKLELDSINVLYVALTRAIEQLYIVTEKRTSKNNNAKIKYTSDLLKSFLTSKGVTNTETNEYCFGKKTRISEKEQTETNLEFQHKFLVNNWRKNNIKIVANSKLKWEKAKNEAIEYGNLLHEIMAKINTESDLEEVLNQYTFNGIISEEEKELLKRTIEKIIKHPSLEKYFNHNLEVFTERSFLNNDKNIEIPDRVVLINNKATIIDYKTGNKESKHIQQLSNYAETLQKSGFKIEKKILVYISDKILVEAI
jgi:ATP-dependent exoDNAse (exonuclease V) beta subunit